MLLTQTLQSDEIMTLYTSYLPYNTLSGTYIRKISLGLSTLLKVS